jgi:Glycosyl hydrolases family 18
MKKQYYVKTLSAICLTMALNSCTKKDNDLRQITSGRAAGLAAPVAAAGLPATGKNKVAYYTFDASPVNQGVMTLTNFTDKANIVVVFEGTLWELADTVHYNTNWMKNAHYQYKKQVLDDIQTLRARGVKVLMNVDDAASWSTTTPFTTYNSVAKNYVQFASFVNDCVNTVGLDGISLDVEHGATDNTNYRNLIKELGKYFGPLSFNSTTKIYTGAFYSGGAPGPIFREVALSKYLNFVMDMAYFSNNQSRFNYWAATLGNAKVMDGMSHQYNSQSDAVAHAQWHPTPDKAGVMVYAANVNKAYTDAILGQ